MRQSQIKQIADNIEKSVTRQKTLGGSPAWSYGLGNNNPSS
jgi:hypothetical protein